ncbi:cupin domain-containing protein [Pseudodesulfovibrio sp. zrk46]|uniref:cupin domain-containing protein n=1 Tax=Pseudodesulfovibrio sp. zrk46 TaxID=2725288 RepID=UPI00144A0012|nr:cupin domain-containing protein [Pseudodesulfovibrio sp. zrk46]QJB57801.1 cupin [Pseudodesulfovibrio sp. zrk46]
MKKIELFEEHGFKDLTFSNYLVHESEFMKVINFNFKAGQQLPVHSHDLEGELTLTILEGEGEFLGADGVSMPAHIGDVLVSEIAEPHGVKAITDMRVLVTIAPPI